MTPPRGPECILPAIDMHLRGKMHGSCALLLSELNVTRFEISATFPPNWRYLSVNKRYISPIKRYKTRNKRCKTRTIASRLNHLAKSFEIRAMPAGRPAPERPWGGRQLPRSAAFPVANQAPRFRPQSPANRLGLYSLDDAAGAPSGKSCNGYSTKCNAYSVIPRLEIPAKKQS